MHHLNFDKCGLSDQYGYMDAELKAGLACVPGQGLKFDGVDDWVLLTNVLLGGPMSFAMWVRLDGVATGSSDEMVFDFSDGGTNGISLGQVSCLNRFI